MDPRLFWEGRITKRIEWGSHIFSFPPSVSLNPVCGFFPLAQFVSMLLFSHGLELPLLNGLSVSKSRVYNLFRVE